MISDNSKKNLIIISGPTAAGKTALSVKLAGDINGSIISADSMQVYKGMDIGSAKITPEEMRGIKHYMIDILEPYEEFNIALFKQYSEQYIGQILSENKIPIIAGGTGFYIQSLLYGVDFNEKASGDENIREELNSLALKYGNEYVHGLLREVDPEAADEIHYNNVKRVIRAIEYYKLTGEKISVHNKVQHEKESQYNYKYFVINMERGRLYENIDRRVDMMLAAGLVDEVKRLKDSGLSLNNISMQGLGYKEIYKYLTGQYSLDEAVCIIKRDTRHFAKRQLTWFKREKDVTWINKEDFDFDDDKIIKYMKEQLNNAAII